MTTYLEDAQNAYRQDDNMTAIAAAVLSLATRIEEGAEQESREEFLSGKWDECDAALGRVLELADELDAHPHATLKPTAFRDLAQRIRDAIDGETTPPAPTTDPRAEEARAEIADEEEG